MLTDDYTQALAHIKALQAQDSQAINPLCRTMLLTHGHKVERAIVFLHGFTNCPQQFRTLAQNFYEFGYNVLNPRIPHHGVQDRLTQALAGLTAEALIAFSDEVIDSAHGLGERVTLVGLSLGGTLALWAAQQRPDVQRVVSVAPLIGPKNVPNFLLPVLVKLALWLPNVFVWWDPKLRASSPGPQHAYPRFSSHALAQILQLAGAVQSRGLAPDALPHSRSVVLVTNAADPAVDNVFPKQIARRWQDNSVKQWGAQRIETYEFDASLNLLHDLIDEQQVGQRTDIVYPVLLKLIASPQQDSAE